jgi:tRNA(His) guanylyltransferase
MKVTEFAERIKGYELIEAGRKFIPGLPIMIRIDGKCFSSFTKGLERPYDVRLSNLMIDTTKFLVEETNACIGYTQSDEISLVLDNNVFFDGRISKITSVVASLTTAFFNSELSEFLPEKRNKLALFDCRCWNVPSKDEAVNSLIWRELDATKNSISMAAMKYYSHNQLMDKNSSQKQEMLFSKGVNWNDYPPFFKRGTYIQKKKVIRKFTSEELDKLPPKHEARFKPGLEVERTEINILDIPPMTKISNRVDVVFNGAIAIMKEED